MSHVLNPDTSKEEISNSELIKEYETPVKYYRWHLYDLMARRASDDELVLKILIAATSSEQFKSEKVIGFIKHSWLPLISVLNYGSDKVLENLCSHFSRWSDEEKELFTSYLKTDTLLLNRLKTICPNEDF